MVVKEHYWYFEEVVPKQTCDHIIKFGEEQKKESGKIGAKNSDESRLEESYRDSDICWLDEPWIFNETIIYTNKANQMAKWNYDVVIPEKCQFTKYKLNQKYNWHQDGFAEPYNYPDGSLHNMTRKLSTIVSLSDSTEYEGGELEFAWYNNKGVTHVQQCTAMLKKGSVVVFPSFVWHRVKPITSGTRYSLVLWSCGPQWR